MSNEGIPPDPYDHIGVPRGEKSRNADHPATLKRDQTHERGQNRSQDPNRPYGMPKESMNRIRAWSLWIIAAVVVTILLIVAVQLASIA